MAEDKIFTKYYDCVGPGWKPILQALGESLSNILNKNPGSAIQVFQVKEKFGELCIYTADTGLEGKGVQTRIDFAEFLSTKVCEQCGRAGESRTPEGTQYGWVKTLCPEHHAERDTKYTVQAKVDASGEEDEEEC